MKAKHYSLLAFFVCIIFSAAAQTNYSDKKAGFSVKIPDGWSKETFDTGELALRCSNPEGTAFYDVNLRKLDDSVSAKEYMEYLESFMPAAGFSENLMDPQKREFDGDAAAYYGADDIYCGTYTKEKNGVEMIQVIYIYRRGNTAYMTVQTSSKDVADELQTSYNVFYNSFKLQK